MKYGNLLSCFFETDHCKIKVKLMCHCVILCHYLCIGIDRSGPVRSRSKKTGLFAWTGPDRSLSRSQDRSLNRSKTGP